MAIRSTRQYKELVDGQTPTTNLQDISLFDVINSGGDVTSYTGNTQNFTDTNVVGGGTQTIVNTDLGGFIKLTLNASDSAEFFENDNTVGIGQQILLNYSPSLTFGSVRKYTAKIDGLIPSNYFEVTVGNIQNGYNTLTGEPTFSERITISEYILKSDSYTEYELKESRNILSNTLSEALYFTFTQKKKNILLEPTIIDVLAPVTTQTVDTTEANPTLNYEIGFTSNFENDLGDVLKLHYEIVNGTTILDSDDILLSNGNTDNKKLDSGLLNNAYINLSVKGELPKQYSYSEFYWTSLAVAKNSNLIDISKWNKVEQNFKINSTQFANGIVVAAIIKKEIQVSKPTITLTNTTYDVFVKDSDTEKSVTISFKSQDADSIRVYLNNTKYISVPATDEKITLYFVRDFAKEFGSKKIFLIPISEQYGTGDSIESIINFNSINDFPSITNISYPDTIDVPSFSDLQIEWDVVYNSFATTAINVELKNKDGKKRFSLLKNLAPNGKFKINLKELGNKFVDWKGSNTITLIFTPVNSGGEIDLTGNEYEINTKINYSSINLDEDIIKKSIFDAFAQNFKINHAEKESKYLTHLANFGNDNQILISSWENDNWTLSEKTKDGLGNQIVKEEVKSIILKLYNPLPANVQTNSTLWVTRLQSNPLVETVVLTEQDNLECPPLKGPNFNIEIDFVKGQSTNYESLDDLILSGSTSSEELISTYLSSSLINTDELNIQYVDGSTYIWNNFVHFSSAKERVNNFVYKVQLIEKYEELISASYDTGIFNSYQHTGSLSAIQERERQQYKKNQIVNGFDGFEKFLYNSSSYTSVTSTSLTWPYNGSSRLNSSDSIVVDWYNNVVELAEEYDIENPNWIQNNIPQYIVNNDENESLLLFFSMIGQHFDNIYYYTKAIEQTRGLGYKNTGGISDKILFDSLKSFGWDPKNLAADAKLWEYVFGKDLNGNTKNLTPAKKRTYEVWRRIINNLPYLLKHKGTRKGIYALLSCYGIPSSNLSILEFGGPESSETTKTKLVMDNITTALSLTPGSKVSLNWQNTDKSRKPDTLEFFIKPSDQGNYNIISASSGWSISLSGSADSDYGYVYFNSGSTNLITSDRLPIFNNKFFGISLSRTVTGSYYEFELNLRQAEKEKTIFEKSYSYWLLSGSSNYNNNATLNIGNNFNGLLDEFRLWSEPLDKERFYEHVSFPEMINGNSVSSSTTDLYFRLDFEYPKNLYSTSSLLNVDTNIYFATNLTRNDYEKTPSLSGSLYSTNTSPLLYATASGFINTTTYPYNFEVVDRSVVLEMPDVGSSRYSTNKVRFESQTLVSNLSPKSRATVKAYDQAPTDSNRVGLFFSPTKELNIDIAKSFGGLNIDNYIGDPSDDYKPNYSELDQIRHYYFKRHNNRNIYEYINLIKLYEKSMFEDIKKMLPARVKATTGLLIEPHFLERSKVAHKKPTGDDYQLDTEIKYSDTTFTLAENEQYDTVINADLGENLIGENEQYETIIYNASVDKTSAESYQYDGVYSYLDDSLVIGDSYQKEVTINAGLDTGSILAEIDIYDTNTIVGQTDYENVGFGLYGQNGYAIRTYIDKDNIVKKERIKVDLIKEQKRRDVVKFNVVVNGQGDERGGTYLTSSIYYETKLNIQPYSSSKVINAGTGSIVEVKPLNGYLPTHYRNTSDLTTGLRNSYFLGSKNTSATTLDGTPPVETFVTNPNTLKVSKAGRGPSEPILEIE